MLYKILFIGVAAAVLLIGVAAAVLFIGVAAAVFCMCCGDVFSLQRSNFVGSARYKDFALVPFPYNRYDMI